MTNIINADGSNILMQEIREAASSLRDSNLEDIDEVMPILKSISSHLGLESEVDAMAFVAIFDRQCACRPTCYEDLSRYFEIEAIDGMQFVPAINRLMEKDFLTIEDSRERSKAQKYFLINDNLFYAIVEDRHQENLEISKSEFDQFDFCRAVTNRKEGRMDGPIGTRKFFNDVKKLEDEHPTLNLVSSLKSIVDDLECRALFYEMCTDYSKHPDGSGMTSIETTLEEFYNRVMSRSLIEHAILDGTHPLIIAGLIRNFRNEAIRLTNKGVRLLMGDNADALLPNDTMPNRYEFVEQISVMAHEMPRHPSPADLDCLWSDVRQFEDENSSINMVSKIKNLLGDVESRLIFYLTADELIDGDTFPLSKLAMICRRTDCIRLKREFKEGRHPLVKHGLIEIGGGGLFDGAQLRLTEKGREIFLEDDIDLFEVNINSKGLILPENIAKKHLYFDESLKRQLSMLESSLSENNYENLCQRLAANNMPNGVAVLLYGYPGTGKTESVMQIARSTGRPIMHVDISATKNCWFGESEKIIKDVFTKYRKLCGKSRVKPILLFNEADAVFAKRKDSTSSSVAQTENAIQNIILEELERLDGILTATTNLAGNLDKAFERRFLMKIRFDRPTVAVKKSIWMDKLQVLSSTDATMLAERYDFSGGEIDNIARKVIMSEVIEGTTPSIDQIIKLCDEEKIGKNTIKVGF